MYVQNYFKQEPALLKFYEMDILNEKEKGRNLTNFCKQQTLCMLICTKKKVPWIHVFIAVAVDCVELF